MAKYTLTIQQIVDSKNMEIFDFDYNLYNNDLKPVFEKFFIEYFFFNEIGFETVGRFKKALQNKLNVIAYKYEQLYKTIVVQETYDFMNTKDLTTITTREMEGENIKNSNVQSSSSTSANGENKNVYSATPKGSIDSLEKYITSGTIDTGTNSANSSGTSTENADSESRVRELITHSEKGNLGGTSDAKLVEDWRNMIMDINQKMCEEELYELFMLIY